MTFLKEQTIEYFDMKTHLDINKILFIVPPLLNKRVDFYPDFPTPPLGIAYISSNTDEYFQKSILDLSFHKYWEQIRRTLDIATDYDLYAFTSMTPNYENTLKIAKYLKNTKDGIFVIGGSHITVLPDIITDSDIFDIGVLGEGENTFRELVWTIKQDKDLDKVKGIVFKNRNAELIVTERRNYLKNLDTLKFPDRHLLPMNKYIRQFNEVVKGERGTTIICSRGCPYNCMFCSKEIFGDVYRLRTPENVVAEIKYLLHNFDIGTLHFIDDTFTINHRFVVKLCEEIIKNGINIKWQCESRVNTINRGLLSKMKKAGCVRIMYGVESGDQRILEKMNKKITVSQILRAFEITRREGIDTGAFIMLGFPGETKKSLEKTIKIVKQIKPKLISVSFANSLPGTPLSKQHRNIKATGLNKYYDYHIDYNVRTKKTTFEDLLEARTEIFDLIAC